MSVSEPRERRMKKKKGGFMSKPLPSSSSCSSSSSPPSFVDNFSELFLHFLQSEGVVEGIWRRALRDGREDFPRHFYSLCSLSPVLFRLGFRSLIPTNPSLFNQNNNYFPLEIHFSFFLNSICHSYLHSSLGTFAKIVDNSTLTSSSSFSFSSSTYQHLFLKMMDIILFSSVEVKELITPFLDFFCHVGACFRFQRVFFLKVFFLNFICTCLEQPLVILSTPLSSGTVALCSHFASVLKQIISVIILQQNELQQQQQQQQQQQPSSPSSPAPPLSSSLLQYLHQQDPLSLSLFKHVQNRLETLTFFMLWEEGEREGEKEGEKEGERDRGQKGVEEHIMEGYSEFFLPLWEDHHIPCQRKRGGDKHTCSMKEPPIFDSIVYFGGFLCREMEGLVREMEEGGYSEGEMVREFGGWMMARENRKGFECEIGGGVNAKEKKERKKKEAGSPVLQVKFFDGKEENATFFLPSSSSFDTLSSSSSSSCSSSCSLLSFLAISDEMQSP